MHLVRRRHCSCHAFTLIELLVVIAIIAILAVVVVLTLNPAQLLAQARDANRVSDMAIIISAIGLYQTDTGGVGAMGTSSADYVSLQDLSAPIGGSNCGTLGLPTLPPSYSYHCAASTTFRSASSLGWVPLNFQNVSAGSPFGNLPIDPTNASVSRLFYSYATNGTQYEVTTAMESSKYQIGGSNDQISGDGGPLASVYEKGTKLGLIPLDYGDPTLVGYWPLNEGTSGVAYDVSGGGNTGSWVGTQGGSYGYYSGGFRQAWAGYFNGTTNAVSTTVNIATGLYTVSLWINPSAGSVADADLIYWGPRFVYSPERAFGLFIAGGASAPNGYYVPTGIWSMVTAVYDGKTSWIYVNGAPIASTTASLTAGISVIGAANTTGYQPYAGMMEDVRVYNRPLSAAQIASLYSGGK